MKKPTPPHFDWTPGNHPEMAPMSDPQELSYRRLWDYCYVLEGLPKDPLELASICRYSPAPSFEKEVWSRIKKHFYEGDNGRLWVGDLESQWKKDKKFRKLQGKKGKWPRLNDLNGQPTVEPNINKEETEFSECETFNIPDQPESNSGSTEIEPESNPIATEEEPREIEVISEMIQETEPQPESNQRLPRPEPAALKVSREANELDPYFDRLAAWENFAEIYPQPGLKDNRESMAEFLKLVINDFWNRRLLRALDGFKAELAEKGWEPQEFIYWIGGQWKVYEDKEPVKK